MIRGAAALAGIVGGVIVATAMVLGPLIDTPRPGAVERFAIFGGPVFLFLGGVLVLWSARIGLLYGVLALAFAVAAGGFQVIGGNALGNVGYTALILAPAMLFTVLCWLVYRREESLS